MSKFVYEPPELRLLIVEAERGFAVSKDKSVMEDIYGEIEGEW